MTSTIYKDLNYTLPQEPLRPFNEHDFDAQHARLDKIDKMANEDVEMQASSSSAVIILDTNILLHCFDALEKFVADLEATGWPLILVFPSVVLGELDGQKKRRKVQSVWWKATRASLWLRKEVEKRKHVKVQAISETYHEEGKSWKDVASSDTTRNQENDRLIIDCARYFQKQAGKETLLLSRDTILCLLSNAEGISTRTPDEEPESSRALAKLIFPHLDISMFSSERKPDSFRSRSGRGGGGMLFKDQLPVVDDNDRMEVDDDNSLAGVQQVQDPRNILHLQVVDVFTQLLADLVVNIAGSEIQEAQQEKFVSKHAPAWKQNLKNAGPVHEWTPQRILSLTDYKRKKIGNKGSVDGPSKLAAFLSKPYSCPRARSGADWTKEQWLMALREIKRVGEDLNDPAPQEAINHFEPYLRFAFDQMIEV